jgi:hypothetical protein
VDSGELAILVSAAATSLVGAMVTDGWAQAKHAVAQLWSRVYRGRADEVAEELEAARAELIAVYRRGDDQLREDLIAEWRSRLRRLLALDAQARAELAEVVVLMQKLAGDQAQPGHRVTFGPVVQTGSGVVSQVGVGTVHLVPESLD